MPSKPNQKQSFPVIWFNDDHFAWSATEAVRQEAQKIQTRKDKRSTILSVTALVVVVLLTIISGDWHLFIPYLILGAGLVMMIGSMF